MPGRRLGVEGPENNSAEKFGRGTRKTGHNFAELPSREIRIMRFGPDSGLAQGYLEKCLGVEAPEKNSAENVSRGTRKTGHNSHRASCARRVSLCEPILRGGPIEILARASSRPKAARRPCLPSLWYSSQVPWHPGGRSHSRRKAPRKLGAGRLGPSGPQPRREAC